MKNITTTDVLNGFGIYRDAVSTYLETYLEKEKDELKAHYWAEDVISRIKTYSLRGKLWRGSLVLATAHQVFGFHDWQKLVPAAGAFELLQSAILAQDDIIDRDLVRRGQPAIHAQYTQLAEMTKYHDDAHHIGESYGICWADAAIFLSQRSLMRVDVGVSALRVATEYYAREFVILALSEMLDVHQTLVPQPVSLDQTLDMYRHKTARYTFTAPMVMAGIYAEADAKLRTQLDEISESIGLIFQIKDDELGIFGTQAETGKSETSDAKEGKRTPFYLYASTLADESGRAYLNTWYGNSQITVVELEEIRQIMRKSGAVAKVNELVENLAKTASDSIVRSSFGSDAQHFLQEILRMNIGRQK